MLTVLIDYAAGNLHSAEKAFQRMAQETDAGSVIVSDKAEDVLRADRVVLPGDGAFPACMGELKGQQGLFEALVEVVETKGRPFLGICVGMQLMAREGLEYEVTPGLGWIEGDEALVESNKKAFTINKDVLQLIAVSGLALGVGFLLGQSKQKK